MKENKRGHYTAGGTDYSLKTELDGKEGGFG